MGASEEVREAVDAYYEAFSKGESREKFFVHDDRVTTLHVAGGRQTGWEEVAGVLQAAARMSWLPTKIELRDVTVNVVRDVAWVVFIEHIEYAEGEVVGEEPLEIDVRVTNVYEKQGSEWLIALHHCSIPDIEQLESLAKMARRVASE